MLIIEVEEIRGKCPVYKKGDKIVIDGPEIVFGKMYTVDRTALKGCHSNPVMADVIGMFDGEGARKNGFYYRRL